MGHENGPNGPSWDNGSERDRKRAYRERKRAEVRAAMSVEELTASARTGGISLTAQEEQLIREHWGYAPSERRTLAERDAAAKRMVASVGGLKPLDRTAFPHVVGRDSEESWSLAPDPENARPKQTKT